MSDARASPTVARLMSGTQAARYCSLSPATFSNWVRQGRMPPPLPGTKRWDRRAIDAVLDKSSGLATSVVPADDPFEAWERDHEARKASRAGQQP